MTLTGLLALGAQALTRNRLRSVLTTLGIVIGVAAVIATLAIGQGARAAVQAQIRALGANTMTVIPGTITAGGARGGMGSITTMTPEDAAAIKVECPAVDAVAPGVRTLAQVVFGNTNWSTTIQGTTADFGAPDVAHALAEHADYCRALEGCGLALTMLPEDAAHPDSTFVEDTAVIARNVAVLTTWLAEHDYPLDDLQAGGALQHTMTYLRRLQHAVTGPHDEGLTLIFVHQAHPAAVAVDHLETDVVEVHVVGHRAGVGNHDVRPDEASALPVGDQIAVAHAGAADGPTCIVCSALQNKRLLDRGQYERRVGVEEFHDRSVRRNERTFGDAIRFVAQQAQRDCRSRLRIKTETDPVPA